MKRFAPIFAVIIAAIIFIASPSDLFASDYDVSITVDGKPITVTVTIDDNDLVTVTTAITDVAVTGITAIDDSPAITGTWATLVDIDPADNMTSEDKFTGNRFYSPSVNISAGGWDESKYVTDDGDILFLLLTSYIGKSDDAVWLRNRIFIRAKGLAWSMSDVTLYAIADGKRYSIPVEIGIGEREAKDGFITIQADNDSTPDHLELLKAIALSDESSLQVRASGGNAITVDVSQGQKEYIQGLLTMYAKLGGDLGE